MENPNNPISKDLLKSIADVVPPQDCCLMIPGETPVLCVEISTSHIEYLAQLYRNGRGVILADATSIQYSLCNLIYQNNKKLPINKLFKKSLNQQIKLAIKTPELSDIHNELDKYLNYVREYRNHFAHKPVGFVVNRESIIFPYYPVLQDGKDQICMPPHFLNYIISEIKQIESWLSSLVRALFDSEYKVKDMSQLTLIHDPEKVILDEKVVKATKPFALML